MPGFDRTGPWGEGPRTGWGRGRCAPSPAEADPGEFRRGLQRGFRRGFCFFGRGGRGYRWFVPQNSAGAETAKPYPDTGAFLARLDERLSRIEAHLFRSGGEKGKERESSDAISSE